MGMHLQTTVTGIAMFERTLAGCEILGHALLNTTQRYVNHLEQAELRAAMPPLPMGDA
jgi:hypothetical protein